MILLLRILTCSRCTTLIVRTTVACCCTSAANSCSSWSGHWRTISSLIHTWHSSNNAYSICMATSEVAATGCWISTASKKCSISLLTLHGPTVMNWIWCSTSSTTWHWNLIPIVDWPIWRSRETILSWWRRSLLLTKILRFSVSNTNLRWILRLFVKFIICKSVSLSSLKLLNNLGCFSGAFFVLFLMHGNSIMSLSHSPAEVIYVLTQCGKVDILLTRASVGAHSSCNSNRWLIVVSLEIPLLLALHIVCCSSKVRSPVSSLAILRNSNIAVLINGSLIPYNSCSLILSNASRDTFNPPGWRRARVDLATSSDFFRNVLVIILIRNDIIKILHLLVLVELMLVLLDVTLNIWKLLRNLGSST